VRFNTILAAKCVANVWRLWGLAAPAPTMSSAVKSDGQSPTGGACDAVTAPRFPPDHAFVVQFGADTHVPSNRCAGRVEHVVSGRSRRFVSADELFDFIDHIRRGQT
jgi:hypothetical protein